MKHIHLSSRLQCIYDAAANIIHGTNGRHVLCDVGCDHAHVPLELLLNREIEHAWCLDIIPGPVAIARENVDRYGLTGQVDVILSDGLESFDGDADLLMITGMGGTMIASIIGRFPDKTGRFSHMILAPQSDHDIVRRTAASLGFGITDEYMVEEDGKFYPVIVCSNGSTGARHAWCFTDDPAITAMAEELYGPVLIAKKDPVLKRYLLRGQNKLSSIIIKMDGSDKKEQFCRQLQCIDSVLKEYGGGL